jgi:hypothetical protein
MDYQKYKQKYFADPQPIPRFKFQGNFGVCLFFEDYPAAVSYYTAALGDPAYLEGEFTRGWKIGSGWLTIFKSKSGNPENVEVIFQMETPQEAEQLHQALIDAGGKGARPTDELMYEPVRFCPLQDPFGTQLTIISPLKVK